MSAVLRKLTWDDLEAWFGSKITGRGRRYKNQGLVKDLRVVDGKTLIGWVEGAKRYATKVSVRGRRKFECDCTCPYGSDCKHSVALLLEYLDKLEQGVDVPCADADDEILRQIKKRPTSSDEEYALDDGSYFDGDDESGDDFEDSTDAHSSRKRSRPTARKRAGKAVSGLKIYLAELSKVELVSNLSELAERFPEVKVFLSDRMTVATKQYSRLLAQVRAEIEALREPGYHGREWGTPGVDLSRLLTHLENLLAAGEADELVMLGPELLDAGSRLVESEHEGESSYDLSRCLDVLFRALEKSSFESHDRLLWIVEMSLIDDYSLCDSNLDREALARKYSIRDWEKLASTFIQRLGETKFDGAKDAYHQKYQRDRTVDWIIRAYEKARRIGDIIELCEREAPITGSYTRLVDWLVEAKRFDEARRWSLVGIGACQSASPGIASQLRKALVSIYTSMGERLSAVAVVSEEFFEAPSLTSFLDLKKISKREKVPESVLAAARRYLETGERPAPAKQDRSDSGPADAWPLPAVEFDLVEPRRPSSFPLADVLIEIAIAEKDPAAVLRWFDRSPQDRVAWRYGSSHENVARAIRKKYPERAIEVYTQAAEGHIAEVSPRGYEEGGRLLRSARQIYKETGRDEEWLRYLAQLKEKNRNRPRCIEVLQRIEGHASPIMKTSRRS